MYVCMYTIESIENSHPHRHTQISYIRIKIAEIPSKFTHIRPLLFTAMCSKFSKKFVIVLNGTYFKHLVNEFDILVNKIIQ